MKNDWTGETVVILASGPSLNAADALTARRYADRVIAVNESWLLCPDADVLYAADPPWWRLRGPTPAQFAGQMWTTDKGWRGHTKADYLNSVTVRGGHNIDRETPIALGNNSSFQALALAVAWGADRVIFLGLDLSNDNGTHWHGDHPEGLRNTRDVTFKGFRHAFEQAAPHLQELGVTVINATPASALECFPKMRLENALSYGHK